MQTLTKMCLILRRHTPHHRQEQTPSGHQTFRVFNFQRLLGGEADHHSKRGEQKLQDVTILLEMIAIAMMVSLSFIVTLAEAWTNPSP